ncbi:MAG TPA: NAD(P)/FAD-dependent oxidoreductase [Acidisarcina sp.]|nr:NAD(P)/FAD-dependent oxidoreductase [Acidisarcina sp.]
MRVKETRRLAAAQSFDVIVLGAGAAGLMCALEAGRRGRRVALLERADRPGKKILISGGGRCNFTNIHCQPENFLSANPHFAKSALALYTPGDFLDLVTKHRIPFHEKTLGQLFCDRSATEIVDMLLRECEASGVTMFLQTHVTEISRPDVFSVRTSIGEVRAPALVIATGGLSIPKMGATAFGYEIARQFGLAIRECRPALVPLTLHGGDKDALCDLSGVSTEVLASFGRARFREKMLITHRGFSGPAILQISSYWDRRSPITLDLAPGKDLTTPLRSIAHRDAASARSALRAALPARLADRLLEMDPPAGWTNHALMDYEKHLHAWPITPAGTEGYDKAEVTAGGVDTGELSARTMESRRVPGLFFIGEVVDVTGHLGGFNFQWAWASGAAAGRAV